MVKRSVLLLRPPLGNNKKEDAAEGFFSQLAEIFKGKKTTISVEIAILGRFLWFFITCPSALKNIIRGQWHSYYPHAEIEEIKDYTEKLFFSYKPKYFVGCKLFYDQPELIPIKIYKELEKNPLVALAGICSSFAKDENGYVQLVLEPPEKENIWNKLQKKTRESRRSQATAGKEIKQDSYLALEEEKEEKPYFRTTIRFLATGSEIEKVRLNLSSMIIVYKKTLERAKMQKLKETRFYEGSKFAQEYKLRVLDKSIIVGKKHYFKFSCSEIATIFHLPYKEEEITQVVEIRSKKAPPPQNLPRQDSTSSDLAEFGETNFQNEKIVFGIKTNDRRRHLYVIGKTGMGKSKLLELLIKADLRNGKGVIVIDPHGDLAKEVLDFIPNNRLNDVIYFNPADIDNPIGFNPMEGVGSFEFRQNIVNGFVAIFKKFFGLNWNERFEHVLRYTTLALLDYPTTSILGIPRMLTDNLFRQDVISYISDPLVKKFWTTEFSSWNEQYASEAIVPIINKIGQFVANPMIRNIVGQAKTTFSFDEIMNKEKILLANLSIGKLGEENSALLGSMLVTKIWQIAIARASLAEEKRKDCFMYVDEFQNFATTAFANILSEARKYRLNLIVAHQYMQQLPQEVRATIFGNIGNIIGFRVGGEDGQILAKEYEPVFNINDFLNLDIRNFLIKMSVDGQTVQSFSAQTIYLEKSEEKRVDKIIELSRKNWSRPKREVEKEIERWEKGEIKARKEIPKQLEETIYFPEPII